MTEADIKNKRKESIRNEHFLFRLLILLGAVRYKVSYDRSHGFRKTYKVRVWHPLTWILIAKKLREAIKDMPDNIEIKFWVSTPDNSKGIEIPIEGMFYDSDSNVLFLE